MTATAQTVDSPGDAELISAVRGGDVDAYGQLFERHVDAARRLARQLVSAGDVDDLVSEAFVKVLTVLQRGAGPDVAFRAYLLTAVRRLRVDRLRAGSRLQTTDEIETFDPGVPFRDTAVEGFESEAAARAFASLPERWQLVLWHTEVEGAKPAEVATLLGMTPNSVSALAYRAREGLRQAFVAQHAAEVEDDDCRWTHQHLGGYIRHGISRRDAAKVENHLGDCRKCMAIYLELTEVNDNLAAILAPLLLGGVAAGYLSAGSIAAPTGLVALLVQLKDTLAGNAGTAAVAGVAAVGLVAGGAFLAFRPVEPAPAEAPAAQPAETSSETSSQTSAPTPQARRPTPRQRSTPAPPPSPDDAVPASAVGTALATTSAPPTTTVASPAADHPSESEPDPDEEPVKEPDKEPDKEPVKEPDKEPAPPPADDPPPPADDIVVTGSYASITGPSGTAIATVTGLPDGVQATLTVTMSGPGALVPQDLSCLQVADGYACPMTSDGSRAFKVTAPQGSTVTFSVSAPGVAEDTGNNSATVTVS